MTKKLLTLIIFATTFSFSNAYAGDDKRKGAHLNISASESVEVEEDLLVVNLRLKLKNPQEVQKAINDKMTTALAEVKKHKKIKVSTEHYSVYKYNPRVKKGEKEKLSGKVTNQCS